MIDDGDDHSNGMERHGDMSVLCCYFGDIDADQDDATDTHP